MQGEGEWDGLHTAGAIYVLFVSLFICLFFDCILSVFYFWASALKSTRLMAQTNMKWNTEGNAVSWVEPGAARWCWGGGIRSRPANNSQALIELS